MAIVGTPPSINEVDPTAATRDFEDAEFVELKTVNPGQPLDGYVLSLFEDSNQPSRFSKPLTGLKSDSNGFFVVGNKGVPGVDLVLGEDKDLAYGYICPLAGATRPTRQGFPSVIRYTPTIVALSQGATSLLGQTFASATPLVEAFGVHNATFPSGTPLSSVSYFDEGAVGSVPIRQSLARSGAALIGAAPSPDALNSGLGVTQALSFLGFSTSTTSFGPIGFTDQITQEDVGFREVDLRLKDQFDNEVSASAPIALLLRSSDTSEAWLSIPGVNDNVARDAVISATLQPAPGGTSHLKVRVNVVNDNHRDGDQKIYIQATPVGNPAAYITRELTVGDVQAGSVGNLIISEVNARDTIDANGDGSINASDEFIEVLNRGATSADLSGYKLLAQNNVVFTFPPCSILVPGASAVVFGGGVINGIGTNPGKSYNCALALTDGSLGLDDSYEVVRLVNAANVEVDDFDYHPYGPGSNVRINDIETTSTSSDPSLFNSVIPRTGDHTAQAGSIARATPGVQVNGSAYAPNTFSVTMTTTPATSPACVSELSKPLADGSTPELATFTVTRVGSLVGPLDVTISSALFAGLAPKGVEPKDLTLHFNDCQATRTTTVLVTRDAVVSDKTVRFSAAQTCYVTESANLGIKDSGLTLAFVDPLAGDKVTTTTTPFSVVAGSQIGVAQLKISRESAAGLFKAKVFVRKNGVGTPQWDEDAAKVTLSSKDGAAVLSPSQVAPTTGSEYNLVMNGVQDVVLDVVVPVGISAADLVIDVAESAVDTAPTPSEECDSSTAYLKILDNPAPVGLNGPVINEIDAVGVTCKDNTDYVEIKVPGAAASVNLTGWSLVFFNAGGISTDSVALTATDAAGYLVIGGEGVRNGAPSAAGWINRGPVGIADGPAAVALYKVASFPLGTPATRDSLYDSVIYNTTLSGSIGVNVAEGLSFKTFTTPVAGIYSSSVEAAVTAERPGATANDPSKLCLSFSRSGADAADTSVLRQWSTANAKAPTPNAENQSGVPVDLSSVPQVVRINEVNATGTEFIEVVNSGAARVSLDGYTIRACGRLLYTFRTGTCLEPGAAAVVFGNDVITVNEGIGQNPTINANLRCAMALNAGKALQLDDAYELVELFNNVGTKLGCFTVFPRGGISANSLTNGALPIIGLAATPGGTNANSQFAANVLATSISPTCASELSKPLPDGTTPENVTITVSRCSTIGSLQVDLASLLPSRAVPFPAVLNFTDGVASLTTKVKVFRDAVTANSNVQFNITNACYTADPVSLTTVDSGLILTYEDPLLAGTANSFSVVAGSGTGVTRLNVTRQDGPAGTFKANVYVRNNTAPFAINATAVDLDGTGLVPGVEPGHYVLTMTGTSSVGLNIVARPNAANSNLFIDVAESFGDSAPTPAEECDSGTASLTVLANSLAAANAPNASPAINELDALGVIGKPNTDFIEIKTQPNANLAGWTLVFFDGNGNATASVPLGAANAGGYVTVGMGAPSIPDGPAAAGLYFGPAPSVGSPATRNNLYDSVIWNATGSGGFGPNVSKALRDDAVDQPVIFEANGKCFSVSALAPNATIATLRGWTPGTTTTHGPTPGSDNTTGTLLDLSTAPGVVRINEVHALNEEFIEVVNTGATAVDLTGFALKACGRPIPLYTFRPGSILVPGAAAVVYGNAAVNEGIGQNPALSNNHRCALVLKAAAPFLLDDTYDLVQLFDAGNVEIGCFSVFPRPGGASNTLANGALPVIGLNPTPGATNADAQFAPNTFTSVLSKSCVSELSKELPTLTVTRVGPTIGNLTLNIASPAGVASLPATVNFGDGESTKTVSLALARNITTDGDRAVNFAATAVCYVNPAPIPLTIKDTGLTAAYVDPLLPASDTLSVVATAGPGVCQLNVSRAPGATGTLQAKLIVRNQAGLAENPNLFTLTGATAITDSEYTFSITGAGPVTLGVTPKVGAATTDVFLDIYESATAAAPTVAEECISATAKLHVIANSLANGPLFSEVDPLARPTQEFFEILVPGASAPVDLSAWKVVMFNASGTVLGSVQTLTTTDANGRLVVGNTGVRPGFPASNGWQPVTGAWPSSVNGFGLYREFSGTKATRSALQDSSIGDGSLVVALATTVSQEGSPDANCYSITRSGSLTNANLRIWPAGAPTTVPSPGFDNNLSTGGYKAWVFTQGQDPAVVGDTLLLNYATGTAANLVAPQVSISMVGADVLLKYPVGTAAACDLKLVVRFECSADMMVWTPQPAPAPIISGFWEETILAPNIGTCQFYRAGVSFLP